MLAIKNVTLETISGGRIEEGSILIKDGKIFELGKDLDLSSASRVIDGKGRILTPGLIDAHTHLGLNESGVGIEGVDVNEASDPISPSNSVRDGINMLDSSFEEFREAGITSVGVLPGSLNIIGGTGLALKCRGKIVDEAVFKDPIGIKVALGENPKSYYGRQKKKSPATRMGSAALLRGALEKAQEYLSSLDKDEALKEDELVLALLPVVRKELPLMIHAHRHDDIATAIRICKEFDVPYVLEHVTDGYLIKELIKDAGVHCAVGPTMNYASKVENKNRDYRTPVLLEREGVPFCFITDHPVIDGRNLMLTASIATQWGMSDEAALRAITLSAAEHIGVADRVGSLEVGKDADLALWSDNPLEFTSFVDMTIIDGQIVYERKVK